MVLMRKNLFSLPLAVVFNLNVLSRWHEKEKTVIVGEPVTLVGRHKQRQLISPGIARCVATKQPDFVVQID